MRIDESMKLLKEYSYVVEDFDRMVLANHEVTKDGYSYGTIFNKYNGDYEVYSYVIDDSSQQIVRLLLYSLFHKYEIAKKYFKDLSCLLDNRNLNYLLEVCKKRRRL